VKFRWLTLMFFTGVSLVNADPITVTLTGFVVVSPYPLVPPAFEFGGPGTIDFSGFGSASYEQTGMAFGPVGISEATPAVGHLFIHFADGSELFARSNLIAGALVPSLGLPPIVGDLFFSGGTEEFAGVTGEVLLTPQAESQRGNRTTYTWTGAGNWSVPEPSSALLLLGALIILCGAASKRQRRKAP